MEDKQERYKKKLHRFTWFNWNSI